MLDKNLLFGFAAGCVLGAVGYKFYNDHKDDINEKIKDLKGLKAFGGNENKEEKAEEGNEEMTLEELEAQKERLEDLIAEMQANRKDNL